MSQHQEHLNQLLQRLEILSKKQEQFHREILDLKHEIHVLKKASKQKEGIVQDQVTKPILDPVVKKSEKVTTGQVTKISENAPKKPIVSKTNKPREKSDIEKFIGENLISKIGVIILVIGVAIGAKYSIENDLISPLTRIILGYLTGISLIVVGMKLKNKYENFSAVLVSGAMTILYFITFMAYSLYDIIPQSLAFVLMLLFTVFTVFAAIHYNRQVIAHIGLVGAYAVPFLLSSGSGKVVVLFTYMAIINIGILVIAIQRYWKPLYYSSFICTWIIYFSWYASKYTMDSHFVVAWIFLGVFFVTFYTIFLFYKLKKKEKFLKSDVFLQLINAFIFFGIGMSLLADHPIGKQLLGVFTLVNALIHFGISVIIYKLKLADRNLFYFISGMVLVFISIAFPVQLDGNWVTLLWAAEAALLFWVGRTKQVPIYEKLAYPVIVLTLFSLLQDWWMYYEDYSYGVDPMNRIPIFNITVLTSLVCAASLGYICYIHTNEKYPFLWKRQKTLHHMITIAISGMLLFVLYMTFFLEIIEYWDDIAGGSNFMGIWLINYTLWFLSIVSFVNIKKIKNIVLGYINLVFNGFSLLIFLSSGLYILSDLRSEYLTPQTSALVESTEAGFYNIGIRYISLLFFAILLVACYYYVRQKFLNRTYKEAFVIVFHVCMLWIASSELIHWLDIAGTTSSDKLGLSILWGIYALLLVVLGLWKKKRMIRIMAFVLFAITLVKLFFYDISHLTTIAKTVVFVSLGVLLLIISFLYNKYKHIVTDEIED